MLGCPWRMRICPLCNTRYEDNVRRCPYDARRPLPEDVVLAAGGDSMLGTTIAERYTIVGRLGAGGMGTVYRAEQAPIGREVALKVLRKDLGRDPETVARFHREAQTLSHLKHPNTVTIFDFGQTSDGLLYLAMELLEGEMLSSRMKRIGPFDVPLAIRIAAGVLRSLAEAHANGIIHRDLKPDNIFLAKVHGRPEEDEVVKVVDFGIAKIRDGERGIEPLQTQEGTVFGTPRYMSPEQAQGKKLDGRSDLYAVGVLLFHMLTGRAPFTDDDAVVVMAHHIKTVPPPVREVAPGRPIPASLEALVCRALEKDPNARPQTAEQFLADLEATLAEAKRLTAASLAPPPAVAAPVARSSRARVMLAAAGLALVALVAGVSAATLDSNSRVRNQHPSPPAAPTSSMNAAPAAGGSDRAENRQDRAAQGAEVAPTQQSSPGAPASVEAQDTTAQRAEARAATNAELRSPPNSHARGTPRSSERRGSRQPYRTWRE